MKPLDVLNIMLLLIVGNCYCIYLQKGTNEMENTQNKVEEEEKSLLKSFKKH